MPFDPTQISNEINNHSSVVLEHRRRCLRLVLRCRTTRLCFNYEVNTTVPVKARSNQHRVLSSEQLTK